MKAKKSSALAAASLHPNEATMEACPPGRPANSVHVWVGGSMGSIPTAPADPIFWVHPCEH